MSEKAMPSLSRRSAVAGGVALLGSTDIYIQKDSPGADKESNWLPAPPGRFQLMMRLYWPDEKPPSLLDGSWKPPAVRAT